MYVWHFYIVRYKKLEHREKKYNILNFFINGPDLLITINDESRGKSQTAFI
ncbi:Uncharacterized protein dnm_074740 [Desulfonema magnum]|uniref:Uncharacterized protein n=1 Tax=Desulfonema magnum TaxID=45655 RepID=A0A975GS03_9BACT|nr:Uncharacterized protein dnm_074740 [Desulfonema magnum]